jgi:osmoprotectant transport system ATP-binding protein
MRLQDEFLSLQEQVRKTVVFVTHDIDEAIKMGDRIAILRKGGVLAQYDTPAEILAHPADSFVEEFVGADRALKRLGLTRLAEIQLASPDGTRPNGHSVSLQASVRDGLSLLLANGGRPLTVLDEGLGGSRQPRVAGLLTLETVSELLDEERS